MLRREVDQAQLHGTAILGRDPLIFAVLGGRHRNALGRANTQLRLSLLEVVRVPRGHLSNQLVDALLVGLTRIHATVHIINAGHIAPAAQDTADRRHSIGILIALDLCHLGGLKAIHGALIAPLAAAAPNIPFIQTVTQYIVPVVRIVQDFEALVAQEFCTGNPVTGRPVADDNVVLKVTSD